MTVEDETGAQARARGAGLLTDRYELTMLSAALADGTAHNPAVFECFGRRLPAGRRFGVAAGLGRVLDLLPQFRFDPDEVSWLQEVGVVDDRAAQYLRGYRFSGDLDAYPEGEVYGPYAPLLTVRSTLAEGIVLETLVLSVLNHDTAIAGAAARMRLAAGERGLIEMGGRRTHEQAAVAAARVAWLAGFDATSNLLAGRLYDLPTVGTSAHAFTLAHVDERTAFDSQLRAQGVGTTLLVDTYDTPAGIDLAVAVAREHGADGPGAIRIDSGDLADEARRARARLDGLGATGTRIVVTGDLDEHAIAGLADDPVDSYGVGTQVVTGSGHPTAELVYKLVAVGDRPDGPLRPVAKTSSGKRNDGGAKRAYREAGPDGRARRDVLVVGDGPAPTGQRPLQVAAVRGGERVHAPTLAQIRERCLAALASLAEVDRNLCDGEPTLVAHLLEDYQA